MQEQSDLNMRAIWRESGLYASIWTLCIVLIGYFLENTDLEWSLEHLFAVGALPTWLITSLVFTKLLPNLSFKGGFSEAMVLGFAAFCYTLFFAYTIAEMLINWVDLDALFMHWWNVFSGGSSNFFVALITLLPTFLVVAVIIMSLIVFTFLLIQAVLCFLSRLMMERIKVKQNSVEG